MKTLGILLMVFVWSTAAFFCGMTHEKNTTHKHFVDSLYFEAAAGCGMVAVLRNISDLLNRNYEKLQQDARKIYIAKDEEEERLLNPSRQQDKSITRDYDHNGIPNAVDPYDND